MPCTEDINYYKACEEFSCKNILSIFLGKNSGNKKARQKAGFFSKQIYLERITEINANHSRRTNVNQGNSWRCIAPRVLITHVRIGTYISRMVNWLVGKATTCC